MITDINRLPDEMESAFVCCDCMDLMRRYPDQYFDIAVVDPPYGINMGHTFGVGRGGMIGRSEDRVQVYGAARSAKTKRNFTTRSTTAQRRTRSISMS